MDKIDTLFKWEEFVPDLQRQFQGHSFNLNNAILVAVPAQPGPQGQRPIPDGRDRHELCFLDGKKPLFWKIDSLRALFRGNKQPPVLGAYPEAYNDSFALLDLHALEISKIFGDPRDAEMKEVFATLRRRPDGRSLSYLHDYMWQAAAWILGTRPLSQAEFEAIMGRLERSCRTFEIGPTSRNYAAMLHSTYGRAAR